MTSIQIPNSVTCIGSDVFSSDLTSITFQGTKAERKAISKSKTWMGSSYEVQINCTDGVLIEKY